MSNPRSSVQKTFFLDQHGCAKNQVDGELLITCLEKNGWIACRSLDQPLGIDLVGNIDELILLFQCGNFSLDPRFF